MVECTLTVSRHSKVKSIEPRPRSQDWEGLRVSPISGGLARLGRGEALDEIECGLRGRIGWANRAVTSELTDVDPPRTWGVRGVDGPIRATVDLTVDALTETRGRLTIAVDFEGHGIGKILVPLVVRPQARKRCQETSRH